MSSIIFTITDYGEMIKGDKLVLRGLMFHGYHGVRPEERALGQKFLIDVDAWMDLQPAAQQITSTVLIKCHQVSFVRVQVGKPHVAVLGPVDYLGVEIVRHRSAIVQS
ncbi:hypothetical protein BUALT_Bualt11G0085800 [Buddleja alternifolia]|uniref:dihydroneopterin aldolase n=1 Tax=Buddleja alternifolia TaxID=168488 RepID=A0AAV6WV99_9LAMI|nr:hypothetical protein BUALT_Bualt11G0085800 [Buddleja alternifolia]